jgi:hypothetical protein
MRFFEPHMADEQRVSTSIVNFRPMRSSSSKRVTIRQLLRAAQLMGPTLVALVFSGVAHAQGTMDFSGAQTLMGTFKTFAIYAGAVICFGGLIFAGIRMLSGRFQDAIPGLFGALFGAGVLGWGAGWIGAKDISLGLLSQQRTQGVEPSRPQCDIPRR